MIKHLEDLSIEELRILIMEAREELADRDSHSTLESEARELVTRTGAFDADGPEELTAGDVVEIANLIGEERDLRKQVADLKVRLRKYEYPDGSHHESWILD